MEPELTKFVAFNLIKINQRELNTLLAEFATNFAPFNITFSEFLSQNNALFFNNTPHFVENIEHNNAAINVGTSVACLVDPNWSHTQLFVFLQNSIKGDITNE